MSMSSTRTRRSGDMSLMGLEDAIGELEEGVKNKLSSNLKVMGLLSSVGAMGLIYKGKETVKSHKF